ncbi:MAG: phosphoribosyl-ATP diphosphatase [Thermoanaerobaculia bacterium]|nr:phosphoribosyl-ATP diphosphatase [Thermoanaerobaculia bacterium]
MATTTDLGWLWEVLVDRRERGDVDASYTSRLLAAGPDRIAQKVGEEAVETIIASQRVQRGAGPEELVGEAADLTYHLLVLLLAHGLTPADVARELERRHAS